MGTTPSPDGAQRRRLDDLRFGRTSAVLLGAALLIEIVAVAGAVIVR